MDNNNTESNSRRLGAAFIVIGWITALALGALLFNQTLFGTKRAVISESDAGKIITITRDHDSHFRIKGHINGIPVTFLVDTGATSVAVSDTLATRAGLVQKAPITAETAAGDAIGYFTMVDTLDMGGVEVKNVSAVIIPNMESNQALLGMNILSKFLMQQTDNTLTLTVPAQSK